MPRFAFAGPVGRRYPEHRDAAGVIVGEPAAGEERDFEDRDWPHKGTEAPEYWPAPDENWFPAGQELPLREPAKPETGAAPPEKKDGGDGGPGDGGGSDEAGDGTPPAPPAATPPAVTPPVPPAAAPKAAPRKTPADSGTAAEGAAGDTTKEQA